MFVAKIVEVADLAVSKVDSPDPVTVGQNLTYAITITNNGPDTATGVTLTDALPGGATFLSSSPSQGTCSGTTTVTCSIGSLSNSASATVTIVVTTNTSGSLSNTATVTANETDSDSANNSATQNTTVSAAGSGDSADSSGGSNGSGGCGGAISDYRNGNEPPFSGSMLLLAPVAWLLLRKMKKMIKVQAPGNNGDTEPV